jgi:acetyl esterase/lipase
MNLRLTFWRVWMRLMFKNQRRTIEEHRAFSLVNARRMITIPNDVEVKRLEIGRIPTAWVIPAEAKQDKVVLHLHGGGYVLGSIEGYQMMCILMAKTLKMKVLLPEYRLAPENPFPAAVEDAAQAYRWLLALGYQSKDIIVSGDSAGGGLSLAAVMSLRDAGDPLPAAVVCMSPWADLTFKGRSYSAKKKAEVMLREDTLREWAAAYAGGENASHPLLSPIYGNFRAFPPLLIQVGSDEILLDDSIMLAEKAKADGVDVTLKVWDGLWHVWQALGGLIPESEMAFEEIGQIILALEATESG